MKNMSFFMTTDQVRNKTKTVTRRFGWLKVKPGNLIQPVVKGMGLKLGEKVENIGGPIRVVSVRREPLCNIDKADCIREGFPDKTPDQFIHMLVWHYQCGRTDEVTRIEFEYV